MSAKATGKIRTPSWDDRSAFRQQLPYARPPNSIRSSISLPSTTASPGSSATAPSKKAASTSARIKNDLNKRLSDFTRETDSLLEEGDENRTRRYIARLNYSTRNKELEVQRNLMESDRANAELVHHRELDRMQKDIDRTQAEERSYARQVELLQLQIWLEEMRQKGQSSESSAG